jgi:Carboxypeptidase regulatory-like domain
LRRVSSWAEAVILFAVVCVGFAQSLQMQISAQAKAEAKRGAESVRYEITGIVVNSVSESSVPRCHLTASLEATRTRGGNRQFPASAVNNFDADEQGHFSITLPSAGQWHLTASARGFVPQAYDEHRGFSSAVVLTAESPTMNLRFKISPEASFTGVVLDEAGEAVRNAQVSLHSVPPPAPGGVQTPERVRASAQTDDRGRYELANLSPGSYRLTVQASPWYAASSQQGGQGTGGAGPSEPPLDVAYPLTWFPGTSDAAYAETIVLHAGDVHEADFRLLPIPSIHLHITPPPRSSNTASDRLASAFPVVQQIDSGLSGPGFIDTSVTAHRDAQGQFDIGGLTPGLYQVRLSSQSQESRSTMVELTANSSRMVDLGTPSRDMARVLIHFDGAVDTGSGPGEGRAGVLQVNLIDTDTRRGIFSSFGEEGGSVNLGRRGQRDPSSDRSIEVPPGRYEVVLQGRPNIYLTGLSAKGADASGRYVTVPPGESTLTVHVASGRASLGGIASIGGKPSAGAMVLLVPITVEEPDSIAVLRLGQTSTDGSFDIANVLPGQYILVAIDHGWEINWGDRSTLRRYLTQGVAVELKSSAIVKQNVNAQSP